MAPPTFSPHANALEYRKADLIVDSRYYETVKYFIAQTVAEKKSFSHQKSVTTRTWKQDLMLACFDDFCG